YEFRWVTSGGVRVLSLGGFGINLWRDVEVVINPRNKLHKAFVDGVEVSTLNNLSELITYNANIFSPLQLNGGLNGGQGWYAKLGLFSLRAPTTTSTTGISEIATARRSFRQLRRNGIEFARTILDDPNWGLGESVDVASAEE